MLMHLGNTTSSLGLLTAEFKASPQILVQLLVVSCHKLSVVEQIGSKMLLEFVLFLVCVALVRYWLFKYPKEIKNGVKKPSAKISFLQSIPVQLGFLFDNRIPNYELSMKWHKLFGNFCYITHPFRNIVLATICDLTIAKQIMSSAAWSDRLRHDHYFFSWTFGKPLGLLFGGGGYWKEARKLTMKLLHQLDFYRQENVETFINFEATDMEQGIHEAVKAGNGEATMTMHHKFEVSSLNVIYQVMLGKRFDREDPVAKKMMSLINDANRHLNLGSGILEIFPWILKVPFVNIMKQFTELNNFMHHYLKTELVEPKRKAKSYIKNPVDFIDYFLLEIDRRAHDSPRYLTDENLVTTLRDLIFAGADTTNTALEHGILHVSLNPHIQQRVQAEIDRVVGARQPRYDDRLSMTYTQAVLHEILRVSTPAPATVRCPLADNEINGEFIPKDSFVAINLYAIHHSPDLWTNSEKFQPERFLNDKGEVVNLEKIIPFGWGKRICVGETVARISLFLFFVTLMQKFTFEISKDHPPPSMKNQVGLSRAPAPYYVNIKCRNSMES